MDGLNAVAAVGLLVVAGLAQAQEAKTNPLGFYVGAEFGANHTKASVVSAGDPSIILDQHTGAWTGFAGLRPYKYFGAELSYADFGRAHIDNVPDGNGNITYVAQSKLTTKSVYLVGYLPLGDHKWDLFAKAGLGRLTSEQSSAGNYPANCVSPPGNPSICTPQGLASASTSQTQTGVVYGVGTQYRFGSLGIRAEYQSIANTSDRPDAYLLGAYWNF